MVDVRLQMSKAEWYCRGSVLAPLSGDIHSQTSRLKCSVTLVPPSLPLQAISLRLTSFSRNGETEESESVSEAEGLWWGCWSKFMLDAHTGRSPDLRGSGSENYSADQRTPNTPHRIMKNAFSAKHRNHDSNPASLLLFLHFNTCVLSFNLLKWITGLLCKHFCERDSSENSWTFRTCAAAWISEVCSPPYRTKQINTVSSGLWTMTQFFIKQNAVLLCLVKFSSGRSSWIYFYKLY